MGYLTLAPDMYNNTALRICTHYNFRSNVNPQSLHTCHAHFPLKWWGSAQIVKAQQFAVSKHSINLLYLICMIWAA